LAWKALARFLSRDWRGEPDVIESPVVGDELPWEIAGAFVVRTHFDEPHAD
jgi:hypothetical protein